MNEYSANWFDLFLRQIDPAQTAREIEFLCRQLPNAKFRSVLDVCCGEGRHAIWLEQGGYDVTAVDRDESVLASARKIAGERVRFAQCDMRELRAMKEKFDAAICMWQSFGYFDEATNASVLRSIAELLLPAGRFFLDVCHREFFECAPPMRRFEKDGRQIVEHKQLEGKRQRVTLIYPPPTPPDVFEWQLYTPEELSELGKSCSLKMLLACTNFDENTVASSASHRMQLVFERE